MTDNKNDSNSLDAESEINDDSDSSNSHFIQKPELLAIATNESYYGLELQDAEKVYHGVIKESTKAKRKRNKKSKERTFTEDKLHETLKKINEKLNNLTLQNEKSLSSLVSISKKKEKKEKAKMFGEASGSGIENSTSPLLSRLKQLQTGKISSAQLQKSKFQQKVKQSDVNNGQKVKCNNEEEVKRLTTQIQETIVQQIKPKLLNIINGESSQVTNRPLNGLIARKTEEASSSQILSPPRVFDCIPNPREVAIEKTTIVLPSGEETEVYRYSNDDLLQLKSKATWEKVPRLLDLNICRTKLTEHESFILRLLGINNDVDRLTAILEEAKKLNLIKLTGPNEFKYQQITINQSYKETPEKRNEIEDEPLELLHKIENFKRIAKNDNELNEMIFKLEFTRLFKDCFNDFDVTSATFMEIVDHLLKTNQAHILEGEIRVNAKNNQEAYITHPSNEKDVCVNSLILRKHAFHGDYVKVLVKNESEDKKDLNSSANLTDDELDLTLATEVDLCTRKFGCVLEILDKRHNRRVIGSLSSNVKKDRRHVMLNVRDLKVPNIRINREGIPKDTKLTEKMLLVAEIIGWCHDQPRGRIVEKIGEKGELKTENDAILIQHSLDPTPFDQHIIDEVPSEPFMIPESEFKYRQDLRRKCIFSIDPETARDLDDAMSCEILPNGNLEIGVHISDVSYFLKENSELDEIVLKKATTIYLVDQVYHMLPVPLCLLCSLLPGADKMAYSVFWEMKEATGEIVNQRITRSVVNSCAKLSYEQAQMVIEKNDDKWSELENKFPVIYNNYTVTDVAEVIKKLQKIAVIMRENRKKNGSLKIDQPKISFKFDRDDQRMEAPTDFFKYPIKDSNRLIEEFMLLANITVAKFIFEKFPDVSLLRCHETPKENNLKKLVKNLQKHGIQLDISSSGGLSQSMENIIANAQSSEGMSAVLNLLVSKTMTRARYFCSESSENESNFWHYALSIPIYTHFTSPIRRYADVLVHRVLNAALDYEDPPSRTPEEVDQLANICNAQKYSAKLAGDDSSNLYFMHFIKSLKSQIMKAGVVGIYDYNFEVVLIETGHVLKVYYKNIEKNQTNGQMVVKTFNDNVPPYATLTWLQPGFPTSTIKFGSEIMLEIETVKDKLVANRILYIDSTH